MAINPNIPLFSPFTTRTTPPENFDIERLQAEIEKQTTLPDLLQVLQNFNPPSDIILFIKQFTSTPKNCDYSLFDKIHTQYPTSSFAILMQVIKLTLTNNSYTPILQIIKNLEKISTLHEDERFSLARLFVQGDECLSLYFPSHFPYFQIHKEENRKQLAMMFSSNSFEELVLPHISILQLSSSNLFDVVKFWAEKGCRAILDKVCIFFPDTEKYRVEIAKIYAKTSEGSSFFECFPALYFLERIESCNITGEQSLEEIGAIYASNLPVLFMNNWQKFHIPKAALDSLILQAMKNPKMNLYQITSLDNIDQNLLQEIAHYWTSANPTSFQQNMDKFPISSEKFWSSLVKKAATIIDYNTWSPILKKIKEENLLIELAMFFLHSHIACPTLYSYVSRIPKSIYILFPEDETYRAEIAILYANSVSLVELMDNLENFRLTDEKPIANLAKICATQNPIFFINNLRKFSLLPVASLRPLIIDAIKRPEMTLSEIASIDIPDQNLLQEIAFFLITKNPEDFLRNMEKFKIISEKFWAKIAKTIVSSSPTVCATIIKKIKDEKILEEIALFLIRAKIPCPAPLNSTQQSFLCRLRQSEFAPPHNQVNYISSPPALLPPPISQWIKECLDNEKQENKKLWLQHVHLELSYLASIQPQAFIEMGKNGVPVEILLDFIYENCKTLENQYLYLSLLFDILHNITLRTTLIKLLQQEKTTSPSQNSFIQPSSRFLSSLFFSFFIEQAPTELQDEYKKLFSLIPKRWHDETAEMGVFLNLLLELINTEHPTLISLPVLQKILSGTLPKTPNDPKAPQTICSAKDLCKKIKKESAYCIPLIRLGRWTELEKLHSLDIQSTFISISKEIFPLLPSVDLSETNEKFRNFSSLLTYKTTLLTYGHPFIEIFDETVKNVFEGTFKQKRYQNNPHLEVVFTLRPDLREKWTNLSKIFAPSSVQKEHVTDDFEDLLLSGTEVSRGCQSIYNSGPLNKALLATINDGKIQLIVTKNKAGEMESRSLIRLLLAEDKKTPVLYLSTRHGNAYQELQNLAKKIAIELGIDLYEDYSSSQSSTNAIISLGTIGPHEYIDSTEGHTLNDGHYKLQKISKVLL